MVGESGESPRSSSNRNPSYNYDDNDYSGSASRNSRRNRNGLQSNDIAQALNGEREMIELLQTTIGYNIPELVSGYLKAVDTYRSSIDDLVERGIRATQTAKDTVRKQTRTLDIFRNNIRDQPENILGFVEAIDNYRKSLEGYLKSLAQSRTA